MFGEFKFVLLKKYIENQLFEIIRTVLFAINRSWYFELKVFLNCNGLKHVYVKYWDKGNFEEIIKKNCSNVHKVYFIISTFS